MSLRQPPWARLCNGVMLPSLLNQLVTSWVTELEAMIPTHSNARSSTKKLKLKKPIPALMPETSNYNIWLTDSPRTPLLKTKKNWKVKLAWSLTSLTNSTIWPELWIWSETPTEALTSVATNKLLNNSKLNAENSTKAATNTWNIWTKCAETLKASPSNTSSPLLIKFATPNDWLYIVLKKKNI